MPTQGPSLDVAAQLADVAKTTILNHRKALESGAGTLKSVTVELDVKRDGQVSDSHVYVEHQGSHRTSRGEG